MRRKLSYWALALLVPLGFTACQQEEDFALQEQEIRVATRGADDTGTFTDAFTLELWSTTDNAKYETHPMTFLSITVSDADNPLTVKVPTGGLTFTAGTHYTFNLKVGKDKVVAQFLDTEI